MIYEFDCGVYPRRLWITYDATIDELNRVFPEGIDNAEKFEELDDCTTAEVCGVRRISPEIKAGTLIRFASKDEITTPTITHESAHVALRWFAYCGCRTDTGDTEPFAYLIEWIAKCCVEVIEGTAKNIISNEGRGEG